MKILVIDDVKDFDGFNGLEITYARTLFDAGLAMSDEIWDEIWFDHDLGIDDIRPLIKELCWPNGDLFGYPLKRASIISMNPAGADWIYSQLMSAYPDIQIDRMENISDFLSRAIKRANGHEESD